MVFTVGRVVLLMSSNVCSRAAHSQDVGNPPRVEASLLATVQQVRFVYLVQRDFHCIDMIDLAYLIMVSKRSKQAHDCI